MKRGVSAVVAAASILLLSWAGCGGSGDTGTGGSGGSGAGSSSHGSGAGKTTSSGPGSGGSAGGGTGGAGGGPPQCASEPWGTYGHDARRTFASDGCVKGPLTAAWHYVPAPPANRSFGFATHAIATKDAAYLQWAATNSPYIGTTALDKVSTAGQRTWTYDTGTDSNLGNWASLALGFVVIDDDGVYYLKDADGTLDGTTGVDWWGQTVPDTQRLYLVNNEHVDGPGIFVGALDATRAVLWQQNQFGSCRIDAGDSEGGLAFDGGVLFYAPAYSFGMGPAASFSSGVFAFDGATGTPKWNVPASPLSTISAGDGHVYLIETDASGMPALTARKQTDGTVAWQKSFTSAGAQAPVLAGHAVIVAHDLTTITAFDAATGGKLWDAMVMGAQAYATPLSFSGGCHNDSVPTVMNPTTTLAAARASDTLVAAAQDGMHLLSLTDGSEQWSGVPANATAPFRDPVVVGSTIYVMDQQGLTQLEGM
ncbi:MAG TPA: PQQ-binding-like beta-propeller repeat protein [Minicystis sp.]|nr:PQQ-binding-like beta-propeller repeat protein [Minicystis sp.]